MNLLGKNVKLKIEGFIDLISDVNGLKFDLEEDIFNLKGDNDFYIAFNTNQISKLEVNSNNIKIYIDLDLLISINIT